MSLIGVLALLGLVGRGGATWSDTVLADNPIIYWPFNETSGVVANDLSGNGLDGTIVASPTLGDLTDPLGEGCFVLNGSTQHILRTTTLDAIVPSGSSPMSMEILAYNAAWNAPDAMFYIGPTSAINFRQNGLHTLSGGDLRNFYGGNDLDTSGASLAAGWRYYAVTWDGTTRSIYGGSSTPLATDTPAAPSITKTVVQAGAIRGAATIPWAGKLSKFALYDYALTPAQIDERLNLL